MDDNEALGSLSADEQAYFDSRGEAPAAPEPKTAEIEVDPEVEAELEEVDGTAQAEIEGKPEPKKLVPLAALTKERAGSKELKAKLQELEKRDAIWQDRWNMVLAANEQPKAEAQDTDPEPDAEKDIFAHNAWLKRQLVGLKAETAQEKQQKAQETAAVEQENKVWEYWHQSAAEYKAANPEFDDATKWMSETRAKQLQALKGLHPQFATEAGVTKQINDELKQIVIAAAQQRISPAEYIHSMAKEWGYSGPKPVTTDAVANLEKVEQAIDASTSLSSVGGSRPQAALDAKAIADMSPSEFETWFAKNGASKFRKMAGG